MCRASSPLSLSRLPLCPRSVPEAPLLQTWTPLGPSLTFGLSTPVSSLSPNQVAVPVPRPPVSRPAFLHAPLALITWLPWVSAPVPESGGDVSAWCSEPSRGSVCTPAPSLSTCLRGPPRGRDPVFHIRAPTFPSNLSVRRGAAPRALLLSRTLPLPFTCHILPSRSARSSSRPFLTPAGLLFASRRR